MIKYVLDIKILGLKIKPTGNANKPWEIICFSDAGDLVSRRSLTGFILYLLGVSGPWGSKSQVSVSLSSSEVECIALPEAVDEMMFVIQLLRSMKISIKLTVMVRVDNVEVILMASNITTTSCTKHVGIRYKYVNKYVEDRVVKIIFVKSADNDSNILMKSLSADLHEKH